MEDANTISMPEISTVKEDVTMSLINSFPKADMMAITMYNVTRNGIRFVVIVEVWLQFRDPAN